MSDSELEMEDFSLADLADVDVSGIEEVRFFTTPLGTYIFEITAADVSEGTNKEHEKQFVAEIDMKIVEVKSVLEAGVDKESLIGKTHSEKLYIKPGAERQKVMEAMGRVKAFVIDVGGEWSANLIENVRNLKGITFQGKITHQVNKDDKSIKYARLRFDK